MKKVFVLAAAVALFATPAFASIVGTKHDLSSQNATNSYAQDTDEVCVYCHTPHGGSSTAPLWNRATVGSITAVYNGSAFASQLDVAPTVAIAQASDAPLCLSCHDGTNIGQALTNPPNSGGGAGTADDFTGTQLDIGGDLSNDHPVGFVWDAASISDPELIEAEVTSAATYGTGGNEFWCSSCHDVHNNSNGLFLFTDNTGSDLCLTCHAK